MAGWGNTKAMGGNNNGPRLDEEVELLQFPPGKWVQVRFIGPLYTTAWAFLNVKKKDGTVSGGFPKICLDYDPASQEYVRDICPYRKGGIKVSQRFFSNVIVRSEQKRGGSGERTESESVPRKMLGEKWHIKDKESDSWTPVKVFSFPAKIFTDLMDIVEASGEELEVNGIANGFDVKIKADPKAKNPADKWKIMKADNTSLSKKEQKLLIYKLDVPALQPEKLEEAKKQWAQLKPRLMVRDDAGKFVPFSSKQGASAGDLEDDEKPKKKKAKRKELSLDDDDKPKKKKKRSIDIEDEEDEAPKSTKKKKKVIEDDEDDEPVNKKKSSKAKTPAKKTSSKTSSKTASSKKKKQVKDLDDDEIPF